MDDIYQDLIRRTPNSNLKNYITNININVQKLKNFFENYYKIKNTIFSREFKDFDINNKKALVRKYILLNNKINSMFTLINNESLQQSMPFIPPYQLQSRSFIPVSSPPQQSYFDSYFHGGKKTKSKYIKTKKVYKIGNKKYIVYLGSRGAKYIKKDKKYISIKSL